MLDLDKMERPILARARLASQLHADVIRHKSAGRGGFANAKIKASWGRLAEAIPEASKMMWSAWRPSRRLGKSEMAYMPGRGVVQVFPCEPKFIFDEWPWLSGGAHPRLSDGKPADVLEFRL